MSASDPTVRTYSAYGNGPEVPARTAVSSAPLAPSDIPGPGMVPGARAVRPSSARPSGARPAVSGGARQVARPAGPRPAQRPGGPRKARLTVAKLDPWGVFKLSFLLSVALGIMYVIAAAIMWRVVDGLGVFTDINEVVRTVEGADSTFNVYDFVGQERVLSLVTVISVANVVILTLLATIFSVLYNLGSGLVGGVRVTLSDE